MDFGRSKSLAQGEKLFREGDPPNEVFWLRSGVLISLKGNVLAGQVTPPAFVGEIGPILNAPRNMTLVAKTPCVLDAYPAREFLAKLTLQSDQGDKFIRSLSDRLEMVREKVREYQASYAMECLRILAIILSEKKLAEKKLQFTDMKNIRRDVEVMLEQAVSKKDAAEDLSNLQKSAKQHGVLDKFEAGLSSRFKVFSPVDLKLYATPKSDSFLDFQTAARAFAEKVVSLTKHLITCHTLSLGRLESEMTLIEETLPFEIREQILKELMLGKYAKGSLDDFRRQITEFDRSVKALAEEPGHKNMPLAAIAKKFEVDEQYILRLQEKWKEYLRK